MGSQSNKTEHSTAQAGEQDSLSQDIMYDYNNKTGKKKKRVKVKVTDVAWKNQN